MRLKPTSALLALLLACAPGLARADYAAGLQAYDSGDFTTAYMEWLPLAKQGDSKAQHGLALLYETGRGVPVKDDAEAAKWYAAAALQGSAKGQYQLGAVYARSAQIKDPVQGYKWLTIAARTLAAGPQGGITADQATTLRALLESEMSKDEIAQAKKEADAFKPKG